MQVSAYLTAQWMMVSHLIWTVELSLKTLEILCSDAPWHQSAGWFISRRWHSVCCSANWFTKMTLRLLFLMRLIDFQKMTLCLRLLFLMRLCHHSLLLRCYQFEMLNSLSRTLPQILPSVTLCHPHWLANVRISQFSQNRKQLITAWVLSWNLERGLSFPLLKKRGLDVIFKN